MVAMLHCVPYCDVTDLVLAGFFYIDRYQLTIKSENANTEVCRVILKRLETCTVLVFGQESRL